MDGEHAVADPVPEAVPNPDDGEAQEFYSVMRRAMDQRDRATVRRLLRERDGRERGDSFGSSADRSPGASPVAAAGAKPTPPTAPAARSPTPTGAIVVAVDTSA